MEKDKGRTNLKVERLWDELDALMEMREQHGTYNEENYVGLTLVEPTLKLMLSQEDILEEYQAYAQCLMGAP